MGLKALFDPPNDVCHDLFLANIMQEVMGVAFAELQILVFGATSSWNSWLPAATVACLQCRVG